MELQTILNVLWSLSQMETEIPIDYSINFLIYSIRATLMYTFFYQYV